LQTVHFHLTQIYGGVPLDYGEVYFVLYPEGALTPPSVVHRN